MVGKKASVFDHVRQVGMSISILASKGLNRTKKSEIFSLFFLGWI